MSEEPKQGPFSAPCPNKCGRVLTAQEEKNLSKAVAGHMATCKGTTREGEGGVAVEEGSEEGAEGAETGAETPAEEGAAEEGATDAGSARPAPEHPAPGKRGKSARQPAGGQAKPKEKEDAAPLDIETEFFNKVAEVGLDLGLPKRTVDQAVATIRDTPGYGDPNAFFNLAATLRVPATLAKLWTERSFGWLSQQAGGQQVLYRGFGGGSGYGPQVQLNVPGWRPPSQEWGGGYGGGEGRVLDAGGVRVIERGPGQQPIIVQAPREPRERGRDDRDRDDVVTKEDLAKIISQERKAWEAEARAREAERRKDDELKELRERVMGMDTWLQKDLPTMLKENLDARVEKALEGRVSKPDTISKDDLRDLDRKAEENIRRMKEDFERSLKDRDKDRLIDEERKSRDRERQEHTSALQRLEVAMRDARRSSTAEGYKEDQMRFLADVGGKLVGELGSAREGMAQFRRDALDTLPLVLGLTPPQMTPTGAIPNRPGANVDRSGLLKDVPADLVAQE